jgi:antagonist of KipI
MGSIEVLEGGLLTTVQDLGRYGYQRYGVPVSGAMDPFAMRAANLLVGNDEGAAGLEITVEGPRLRFVADTVIAITGADLGPQLDGQPTAMWKALALQAGSILSFGVPADGIRAFLAVAGGIEVPLVLASRSTFTRSKLGGHEGRALRSGDTLPSKAVSKVEARRLPWASVPSYGHQHSLRVVLGPQDDAFTDGGRATFLSATYSLTPQADRIGCRLRGPQIEHKSGADIVSDGIPFGAVQVSGDGMPIVLLADRGTTGGYTKIATVISADLGSIVQAIAEDTVTFETVTLAEAHQALREQEALLEQLRQAPRIIFLRPKFRVSVGESTHEVMLPLQEASSAADGGSTTSDARLRIGRQEQDVQINVERVE